MSLDCTPTGEHRDLRQCLNGTWWDIHQRELECTDPDGNKFTHWEDVSRRDTGEPCT